MNAPFPLRLPIQIERYDGAGEDELGNEVEGWGPPEDWKVVGMEPPVSAEPELAGHDRVVVDAHMYIHNSLNPGPKDRITVKGRKYEVIGYPQDASLGPWWDLPYSKLLLRYVEG